jgi:hypothetical protein
MNLSRQVCWSEQSETQHQPDTRGVVGITIAYFLETQPIIDKLIPIPLVLHLSHSQQKRSQCRTYLEPKYIVRVLKRDIELLW